MHEPVRNLLPSCIIAVYFFQICTAQVPVLAPEALTLPVLSPEAAAPTISPDGESYDIGPGLNGGEIFDRDFTLCEAFECDCS